MHTLKRWLRSTRPPLERVPKIIKGHKTSICLKIWEPELVCTGTTNVRENICGNFRDEFRNCQASQFFSSHTSEFSRINIDLSRALRSSCFTCAALTGPSRSHSFMKDLPQSVGYSARYLPASGPKQFNRKRRSRRSSQLAGSAANISFIKEFLVPLCKKSPEAIDPEIRHLLKREVA